MITYKLDPDVDTWGTSLPSTKHAYIQVAGSKWLTKFGTYEGGDNYKVSGQWIFTDPLGNVFTVYDYKMTSLYDPSYQSPEEFWKGIVELHIGTHCNGGDPVAGVEAVKNFSTWLLREIEGHPEGLKEAPTEHHKGFEEAPTEHHEGLKEDSSMDKTTEPNLIKTLCKALTGDCGYSLEETTQLEMLIETLNEWHVVSVDAIDEAFCPPQDP